MEILFTKLSTLAETITQLLISVGHPTTPLHNFELFLKKI
jgi:hypothetical protein